jgi:hypothetical protein
VQWNMSISCDFIISGRKHSFTLKLSGYSKDYETYIWRIIQAEFPSFTVFLDFQNPQKNPEKSQKILKSQKIPKSQIRCFPLGLKYKRLCTITKNIGHRTTIMKFSVTFLYESAVKSFSLLETSERNR